jgi:hypothetical protein
MPKKARRRPIRRRPQDRSEEVANKQRSMEIAARGLLGNSTPDQLRSELTDRETLLEEADRLAQFDPNPANLARYRTARSQLDAVKRAIQIADSAPRDDG